MARRSGKKVYSEWSSGNLVFKNESGTEILTFDGVNTRLSFDGAVGLLTPQSGDTQGKLKFDATIDVGAMDDGYGVWEVNLNCTGVWTGHGAAASAWANVNSATIGAGNYICARNDGVYEAAGGTITNAKVIFGARMQKILSDTDALSFPFSVNTNNTAITALFDVNNLTDLGMITDNGSDDGTLVPLMRNAAGTLKYVKLYNLA